MQPPAFAPILTRSQLDIFSRRFLCELCHQTGRIIDRTARKRDIFDRLGLHAFEEKAIPQVIDEIVQNLIFTDLATNGHNEDAIKLTRKGLEKCQDCKE